jgi:hypothetical protein
MFVGRFTAKQETAGFSCLYALHGDALIQGYQIILMVKTASIEDIT